VRHKPARAIPILAGAVGVLLFAAPLPGAAREPVGIVIESLAPGSVLSQAGLVPGDVLLGWERDASASNPQPARGDFRSPFDVFEASIEQSSRGPMRIVAARGTFALRVGDWRLKAAPGPAAGGKVSAEVAAWLRLRETVALVEADRGTEAQLAFDDLVSRAKGLPRSVLLQILCTRAQSLADVNELLPAAEVFRQALAISDAAQPDSLAGAWIATRLGYVMQDHGDLSDAEALFRRALEAREKAVPESLDVSASLNHLGIVADDRGDPVTAERFYRRALAIQESLAPGSLTVAKTLVNLGFATRTRGDLAGAEDWLLRALAIQESHSPGGRETATALNNLGTLANDRGDLAAAEQYYRRSLAIVDKLAPNSRDVTLALNNLGVLAMDRGDLVEAEQLQLRTLAIREATAPDSLDVAASLNSLGLIAAARADRASAEQRFRRALAIRERLAPESLAVAEILNALGSVAADRGDFEAAWDLHGRAVAIQQRIAPESPESAIGYLQLARVARQRNDFAAAREDYERAASIEGKLAPDSLPMAAIVQGHGELLAQMAAHDEARRQLTRALELHDRLAPGSAAQAATLRALARLDRDTGDLQSAADRYRQSIGALETQTSRLGGSQEAQAAFVADHGDDYRELIEVLLRLGRPDEAIGQLERSRARGLLAMLAERDLVFAGDIPAELESERRLVERQYEEVQAEIGTLSAVADAARIEELDARRRSLRDRQARVVEQIRSASPRRAALQYPQPLDLEGIRRTLDPGTLLLAYSVGGEKSFVFAVSPKDGLRVFPLPMGRAALAAKVDAFRTMIGRRATADDSMAELRAKGRELYALLLEPADRLLARAERVVIVPDGPLNLLPFAAVVRRSDYLAAWKPIHGVVSMTVYAELKNATRRPGARRELVAFGDPIYPAATKQASAVDPRVASLVERNGATLEPLPATRAEVERIAALYGDGATTYLGAAATEEQAKAIGTDARMIHFACHGVIDERFPLDSALALTIRDGRSGAAENGMLQAWEIFERVRIDADLVTLSACDTALGQDAGGEGLIGLTRAFQYAGARSILASLWGVGDVSTTELMTRFYAHLSGGMSKDAALREAQRDLLRNRATAHPFHWAAFELIGDWR